MTPQREKFCQEIVKGLHNGKPISQSAAYRLAYKPKRASRKTVREKASRLMRDSTVAARIKELMAPLVANAQITREQWIADSVRLYRGDVRKLFDARGKLLPLPLLGDSEAAMIESFEAVEQIRTIMREDTTEERVCVRRTTRVKLTPFLERHQYVGKALGFYQEKGEVPLTLEQLILGAHARRAERNAKEEAG